MSANRLDEMVRGYLKGLESGSLTLPDCYKNESSAFRHGWMNGRDDRVGCPRERAAALRARANMILGDEQ